MLKLLAIAPIALCVSMLAGCGGKQPLPPQRPTATPASPLAAPAPAPSTPVEGYVFELKKSMSMQGKETDIVEPVFQALSKKMTSTKLVQASGGPPAKVLGTLTVRFSVQWDAYGDGSGPRPLDAEDAMMVTNKLPRKLTAVMKIATSGAASSWDGDRSIEAEIKNPDSLRLPIGGIVSEQTKAFANLANELAKKIDAMPEFTRK